MVAERLLDAERIMAATPGRPGGCLQGLAGTALLHARMSAVSPIFANAAYAHWTAAARATSTAQPSIFDTPGGLAASLILGQGYLQDPSRQLPATVKAVRWLSAQATATSSAYRDQLRQGMASPTWALYDIITGLSGVGRILLAGLAAGNREAEQGLVAILDTLTTMIATPRSRSRPGWWLPAAGHPSARGVPPSGAAETGMAHGIAGPLALLSIAASAGWSVSGQADAIQAAASWLLAWQVPGTRSWPPRVTGAELDSGQPTSVPGRRDAWCYGAPGIGRALILAGRALGSPVLIEAGQSAQDMLARRAVQHWDIEGPAICHGTSGVLQSTTATSPATAELAASATIAAHDPRYAFGFRQLQGGAPSDDPGLLTGAAGIALVLADHGRVASITPSTRWDAVLLLA